MLGISWGGFNGLQVAARRPPALKAVISMCASDDRYADDVHYVGGCVLAVDMLPWAATMLTRQRPAARPGRGRRRLARHLAASGSSARRRSSRRGSRTSAATTTGARARCARTTRRSRCPSTRSAAGPTATRNAIPRLIAGLPGPRKGLIGPWSHAFPQDGEPGPAIGFLQECLRWFDQRLKGIETGIMDEPRLRVWMQEPVAPADAPRAAPRALGRPSRRGRRRRSPRSGRWDFVARSEPISHRSIESTGIDAGAWCADGGEGDWPGDQRAEDERSLTFTSAPLDEPIEILGFPEVDARDRGRPPDARSSAVRLCDVAPDGASLLITRGVLNLTHRDGHDDPQPLEPGQPLRGHDPHSTRSPSACPPGTALRVAVSTAYWPWVWPSPEPVTLTLHARPPGAADARAARPSELRRLRAAGVVGAAGGRGDRARPDEPHAHATTRPPARTSCASSGTSAAIAASSTARIEMDDTHVTTYRIVDGDPLSASVRVQCELGARPRGVAHARRHRLAR